LRVTVAATPEAAADVAAAEIAAACIEAVAEHGRALVAVSGGETPWLMLRSLREQSLPWRLIRIAQVDERVAPFGDFRRNLTRLGAILVQEGPLPAENLLWMPVGKADLESAAVSYQQRLEAAAGRPLVFDLVQLGLGLDGHTASLVPGDPVLEVRNRDVAMTGEYQGLRRMTLTYPALQRAARRLWLVTGASKAQRLAELAAGHGNAPALQVPREGSVVVTDRAAASAARLADGMSAE
jgi:6-phosphogluconolactonase